MTSTDDSKPSYRVPSMEEVRALPWNGLRVASTFSGCGGSCLGYRMAGFRVVWANEFVPSAQETYKANADPSCMLDGRDIKLVKPEEVLAATGLQVGELDVFDGSPPCQAFSTAGKREKNWGKEKHYEGGARQCNEQLFDQYIRLLRGLQPRAFIAENVSGLVKGAAKGYFLEILAALKASGYRVKCRVLDAQWLGVPQARQRTIFMGVRADLEREPLFPEPLSYRYTVRDALPHVVGIKRGKDKWTPTDGTSPTIVASGSRHGPNSHFPNGEVEVVIGNDAFQPKWGPLDAGPSPTILASGAHGGSGQLRQGTERRRFTIDELKRICSFPDDFELTGSYAQQWERLGNSVPPLMMRAIAQKLVEVLR